MTDSKTTSTPKTASTAGLPGGLAGGIINEVLSNPETQKKVLSAIFGFLVGLFKKKQQAPPVLPGGTPTPNPNQHSDEFPDDTIPAPPDTSRRKVTRVEARLTRLQWNRQMHPEKYDGREGTDGLYENPRSYEGGRDAINIASKAWIDLYAYDQFGKEFLRDAVVAQGLQYKTEHHVGEAYIKGKGGQPGAPTPGYETNDTNEVGNGITAWESSMGFLHQVKLHAEGTFEVYGVVDGVESNHFTIRVD